jgi:hypothetical protein
MTNRKPPSDEIMTSADVISSPARRINRPQPQQPQVIIVQQQTPQPVQATPYFNPRHTGQIITIEKTGKGLKLQRLLANLMLLIGVGSAIAAATLGPNLALIAVAVMCLLIAIPWLILVRMMTWWKHG